MNLPSLPKNLVQRIWQTAELHPDRLALVFASKNENLSFKELVQETNLYRQSLRQQGLVKGDRVLVLMPPEKSLFIFMLALFAEGLVPILVDPRLPRAQWRQAFKDARPKATLMPLSFRFLLGLQIFQHQHRFLSLKKARLQGVFDRPPILISPEDESLVTLTSGTTGQAKVIIRSHSVLGTQQNFACALLPRLLKDIHLAGYPVSVLQSLVEGAVTYPVSARKVDDALKILKEQPVTRLSGPPGFIAAIVEQLIIENYPRLQIENVLLGGAPLPDWLLRKIYKIFPKAQVQVIYGATEAEPISFTEASECFLEHRPGYLVGAPLPEIKMTQNPFPLRDEPLAFEIILQGPHISAEGPYATGDIAVLTETQKLRLIGRKAEVFHSTEGAILPGYLESLLEKKFPEIRRVAILFQNESLFAFIEFFPDVLEKKTLEVRIHEALKLYWTGALTVRTLKVIPVDQRHQWKINKAKIRKQFL